VSVVVGAAQLHLEHDVNDTMIVMIFFSDHLWKS
jgi:hypothetical protein